VRVEGVPFEHDLLQIEPEYSWQGLRKCEGLGVKVLAPQPEQDLFLSDDSLGDGSVADDGADEKHRRLNASLCRDAAKVQPLEE